MKSFSLEGRAALVTGSSQGIGLAMAQGLREAGARVVHHGLTERPAEMPQDVDYIACNLCDSAGPEELMTRAFAAQPSLDILVCNAGGFFDRPLLEMTRERWDQTMSLNLAAPFFLAQAFARRLIAEKRGGSIVITSSTNGFQAESDSSAYDTSKGGLVMMTRSLAVSLAPHGIRVNGIAPGLIRTPLTDVWLKARAHDLLPHYERNIPLARIGAPQDCSGAVVFLCSEAAGYITGEIIVVDGGLTVQQIGPM